MLALAFTFARMTIDSSLRHSIHRLQGKSRIRFIERRRGVRERRPVAPELLRGAPELLSGAPAVLPVAPELGRGAPE